MAEKAKSQGRANWLTGQDGAMALEARGKAQASASQSHTGGEGVRGIIEAGES